MASNESPRTRGETTAPADDSPSVPLRKYSTGDVLELDLRDHDGVLRATVERVVCVGGECRLLLEQGVPSWRWRLMRRPGGPTTASVRLTDSLAGWEDRGPVASLEVVHRAE